MVKRFNLQVLELYTVEKQQEPVVLKLFSAFFIYYNRLCCPMLGTSLDNLLIMFFNLVNAG